jgi:mono/diheme cytochrome c family protein
MSPSRWAVLLVGMLSIVAGTSRPRAAGSSTTPTFTRDILPIAQKNCQSCHRPGQIGPFSMLSYEGIRPWVRSIKAKVQNRQMPPWFADEAHGQFANNRSLDPEDIDTIVKWVDAGAPQDEPQDAPPPIQWAADGWQTKPDLIMAMPEFRVPARPPKNVIEWSFITIPSGLTKDTLVSSMEIKPSDLTVTHHICLSFSRHRPGAKYYEWTWGETPRDEEGVATDKGQSAQGAGALPARRRPGSKKNGPAPIALPGVETGGGFACYVPGAQADDYRPFNAAKLIPANSDITIQVHYTPTGKEVVDRPLLGFALAKAPTPMRWISYTLSGAGPKFAIPPNEPNYQSPPADAEFGTDAWMVQMMPHMHLRGKDMVYKLTFPDGREQVILNVPKYDFNWQLVYQPMKPIFIPKGTRLHVDAHYDNSTGNRFNPNPNITVYPGRMTWEEMMAPFFGVIVDSKTDPAKVLKLLGDTVIDGGA